MKHLLHFIVLAFAALAILVAPIFASYASYIDDVYAVKCMQMDETGLVEGTVLHMKPVAFNPNFVVLAGFPNDYYVEAPGTCAEFVLLLKIKPAANSHMERAAANVATVYVDKAQSIELWHAKGRAVAGIVDADRQAVNFPYKNRGPAQLDDMLAAVEGRFTMMVATRGPDVSNAFSHMVGAYSIAMIL